MSSKHWLLCHGKPKRGPFYGTTAPPTGLMGRNSKVAELNWLFLPLLSIPLLFSGQKPRGNPLWWDTLCPLLFHLAHNTVGQSLSEDGFCTFSFCRFTYVKSLTYPGFYFCYLWFNSFSRLLGSFLHLISLHDFCLYSFHCLFFQMSL